MNRVSFVRLFSSWSGMFEPVYPLAVFDILNGDVFPVVFSLYLFFLPIWLIKPCAKVVSLSFCPLLPHFFVEPGGISKCLILVFDQSWGQRRIRVPFPFPFSTFYLRSPFVSGI